MKRRITYHYMVQSNFITDQTANPKMSRSAKFCPTRTSNPNGASFPGPSHCPHLLPATGAARRSQTPSRSPNIAVRKLPAADMAVPPSAPPIDYHVHDVDETMPCPPSRARRCAVPPSMPQPPPSFPCRLEIWMRPMLSISYPSTRNVWMRHRMGWKIRPGWHENRWI